MSSCQDSLMGSVGKNSTSAHVKLNESLKSNNPVPNELAEVPSKVIFSGIFLLVDSKLHGSKRIIK